MTIRYHCRHCKTEIGSLPFESARETLRLLEKLDQEEEERFLTVGKGGEMTVRCICEECEHTLRSFPDYYTFTKWIQ
ncbi:anti-sigma-F factor Fin [Sporosarcina jiandibaonis]|uniref:anti-sigma-F factor Fin n=1 Tax=Sporosarcina jiandibaonis TaxID=2715535 RepID=UPI001557E7BD